MNPFQRLLILNSIKEIKKFPNAAFYLFVSRLTENNDSITIPLTSINSRFGEAFINILQFLVDNSESKEVLDLYFNKLIEKFYSVFTGVSADDVIESFAWMIRSILTHDSNEETLKAWEFVILSFKEAADKSTKNINIFAR